MPTNIYILKLRGGNYYVGKSADPEQRIQQHFDGIGSAWTKLNKPLKVERIIRGASDFDEDRYVKEYISKYGIDKVRGGAYANIHLDKLQVAALERELRGASDACVRCGRQGHFASNCYAQKDKRGKQIEESDDDSSDDDACYRCGRQGHFASNCYARRDIDGDTLSDDSDN
jgi:predicted GIY-YIG superfamily endonuclease